MLSPLAILTRPRRKLPRLLYSFVSVYDSQRKANLGYRESMPPGMTSNREKLRTLAYRPMPTPKRNGIILSPADIIESFGTMRLFSVQKKTAFSATSDDEDASTISDASTNAGYYSIDDLNEDNTPINSQVKAVDQTHVDKVNGQSKEDTLANIMMEDRDQQISSASVEVIEEHLAIHDGFNGLAGRGWACDHNLENANRMQHPDRAHIAAEIGTNELDSFMKRLVDDIDDL